MSIQRAMATLNASCHSNSNRAEYDYYATPPEATYFLLQREKFRKVWEPACGCGHISDILKEKGLHYRSSDLINRGYGDVLDFLEVEESYDGDIITNPPFSLCTEFTYKAMEILKQDCKLALLLRIQFLESVRRKLMFRKYPPKKIYVFSSNIRCAKNGDFANATGNASTYAWFIWQQGNTNNPTLDWI